MSHDWGPIVAANRRLNGLPPEAKATLRAWAWSLSKRAYGLSRGKKSNAAGWTAIAVAVWQMGWADTLSFATKDPATALVIGAWLLGQADKLWRLLWAKWQARQDVLIALRDAKEAAEETLAASVRGQR